MVGGSLLAGVAGFCAPPSTRCRRCSRCAASPASARRRCSSPPPRSSPTSLRPTAGPRRPATSPSPCSAASGSGPIIGEAVFGDDRFHLRSSWPAGFTVLAAVLSLAVPARRPRAVRRRRPRAAARDSGSSGSSTPPRSAPDSCWRPASPRSPCSRRSCPSTPARSASPDRVGCSPPTASCASCCASPAPGCPSASGPAAP